MVETSAPKNKDIEGLFNTDDWPVINAALNLAKRKIEDIPELIENEVLATYEISR